MPKVYPFQAIQYARAAAATTDVSALVAPPYDVLDGAAKAALLTRSTKNIVAADLPHIPAKELGPPEAYAAAAKLFRSWLSDGTMHKATKGAMFVYRETFQSSGRTFQRTGMACTVETAPFGPRTGGGILPHEETFSGPKEDRLALMKATGAQLSPIFGLHADEKGGATAVLLRVCASREPDITADMGDGVKHEVWTVDDAETIAAYQAALSGDDIFIADGHHRYNTALNYLRHLEQGGPVPDSHPARRCMMVLVGMNDPGMVIWPTHRVLGGMSGYSWPEFYRAASKDLRIEPCEGGLAELERAVHQSAVLGDPRVGLYDFATGAAAVAAPASPDPLAARFPEKPRAWRDLDVAFVQYVIVEAIAQPLLNAGQAVKWAFPHTVAEVEEIGAGHEKGSGGGKGFAPQLGVILRPTPLEAVKAVSRAGELMPQKSTFFFPKLATGLFMNDLT
ncbi:MAG: DUF1015 domain-containing protein [Phycisphaeraceae bacterium]|nr:DUF1015 domain-containing protein [Phycisphaeraceae bacterium]